MDSLPTELFGLGFKQQCSRVRAGKQGSHSYDSQSQISLLQIPGDEVYIARSWKARRPCSLLLRGPSLCSDKPGPGGLGSTGRECGPGTCSTTFIMGNDSADSFQGALKEADQGEPEQDGKGQVDLHGCSSWCVSTNDTSCWGRPDIAGGH